MIEQILFAPYLRNAFLFLLCLSIAGSAISVLVNLRRMEFTVEALVHSVFPGIVVGLIVGGIPGIVPGAAAVATVTVLVLASLGSGQGQSAQKLDMEAGTAVVLTFMYGIGVVISLAYGDKSGQLEALMFGRLLDVTQSRLATSVTLCVIAALLILTTWRMQILVAFDTTAARAMGINVAAYELIANIAVGLIVVAASSAVGVLLVIGFIVIPGLSARLIAGSPRSMCFWAAGLSTLAVVVGFAIMLSQTTHQISPQAIVSLMLVATVPLAGLKGVFS